MDKVPHRAVVHREASFAQLGHQTPVMIIAQLVLISDQPVITITV
jgi:hypothetical protein